MVSIETRRRRGPGKQVPRERGIHPRHSQVGQVLIYAWIHPAAFERRKHRKGGIFTHQMVMEHLHYYCKTHYAQAEVFEGYPPVLRPDDDANGWQSIFVVRTDDDFFIRSRVQAQMRRLGCYTAISYEPFLPSERGNI